jgi:hypothetical protein
LTASTGDLHHDRDASTDFGNCAGAFLDDTLTVTAKRRSELGLALPAGSKLSRNRDPDEEPAIAIEQI